MCSVMELLSDQARQLAKLLVTDSRARELATLLITSDQARNLATRVIGADAHCTGTGSLTR